MNWKFHEEKMDIATRLGYSSVEEAFIMLYHNNCSMNMIADIFNITQPAVHYRLHQMGVDTRTKGGDNRSENRRAGNGFIGKWNTKRKV